MALDIEQIKNFQVGNKTITQSTITVIPGINPTTGSNNLQKTIQDISQLTLKSNEISSFLSEANLDGGNKPFSILEFAKNLVTKQEEQPQTENSQITDPNPLAKQSIERADKDALLSILQGKGISLEPAAFEYPSDYQVPAAKRLKIRLCLNTKYCVLCKGT